jgi:hypothetical protein
MRIWEEHEAGEQLERVLELCEGEGPQMVAQDGKVVAVFMTVAEWERLKAKVAGDGGSVPEP